MTVDVLASHEDVTARVFGIVSEALRRSPALTLGLPTGQTPVALYAALAAAGLDWSQVRTFNLDEFATLGPAHPGSFRAFMDRHLFSHVNLRPEAIGFLRGDAPDEIAECRRYDAAMAAAGGLDLLLLGLGANGHLGFNEPAEGLEAATHPVALHQATRAANATAFGGDWRQVPPRALTIGLAAVLGARRVVLMATGAAKAAAVAAMVQGPLTTRCPASWLQTHVDARIVIDAAAAAQLAR